MRDQLLGGNAPGGNELKEGFKVALLRPADIGQWVIAPALFVVGVVAAWSGRHGQPQVELALVERLPVELHANQSDDDDTPLHAADGCGPIDRIVGRGGGSQHDRIRPMLCGKGERRLFKPAGNREVGAQLLREGGALRIGIVAEDTAAISLEQLDGE